MSTVEVTFPGPRAKGRDRYRRVTLRVDGSPFRWVFRYMEMVDHSGDRSLACVETAIEQDVEDPAELEGREDVPALTRPALADWGRLEKIARANLALELGGSNNGKLRAKAKLPERRIISPEFLTEIADRYRAHVAAGQPPAKTIMIEERVSRRTVANWIAAAREKGLLS